MLHYDVDEKTVFQLIHSPRMRSEWVIPMDLDMKVVDRVRKLWTVGGSDFTNVISKS